MSGNYYAYRMAMEGYYYEGDYKNRKLDKKEKEFDGGGNEWKTALRKIVKNAELDSITESYLISRINQNKIKTENELKEEIQKVEEIDKIRKERRNELKRMVKNAKLDYISETNLLYKIKHDEIVNERTLESEINKEIQKVEAKERERINELITIVDDSDLDSAKKSDLITEINQNKIISEKELTEIVKNLKIAPVLRILDNSKLSYESKQILKKGLSNEEWNKKRFYEEMLKLKDEEGEKKPLLAILNNSEISTKTKKELENQINKKLITNPEFLKKTIDKEIMKKELINYVETNTILKPTRKEILKKKIMNNMIKNKDQLIQEIGSKSAYPNNNMNQNL